MHIAFVSYWGLNEGLSQATVIPHIRILADRDDVSEISFITLERKGEVEPLQMEKVKHHMLYTSDALTKKLFDKGKARKLLEKLHKERAIDLIIARSSLAGWLILDFAKAKKVPFAVESFEPHADYMLESGVWKRLDPRYVMTKAVEKRLRRSARYLLPVTRRYADHLVNKHGVDPSKILVMPCCVDTDQFAFSGEVRERRRSSLGIPKNAVVGIYTGKLGGIYLKEEALALFHSAKDYWGDRFHLIILSPDKEDWQQRLEKSGYDPSSYSLAYVRLDQVPEHLSAADIAFSLHRPGPSSIGISPIKNAEYLANGLPIIMPQGIGDDAHMVEKWNLGVTFSLDEIESQAMFNRISGMVEKRNASDRIAQWAAKHRSFDIVRKHYDTILRSLAS